MLICRTLAVVYPFAIFPRNAKLRGRKRGTIIIEINTELTLLMEEGISDYLLQGKTVRILARIVERMQGSYSLTKIHSGGMLKF